MMKTCANCGKNNEGQMRFCSECGHPLAASPSGQNNPPAPIIASFPVPPNPTHNFTPPVAAAPKKSKLWILGLLSAGLLIGLLGLGTLVFLLFSLKNGDHAANGAPRSKTAIVGKWQEQIPNGGTLEFQADKKLNVYDRAGKVVMQGSYELLGEDSLLLFKSTGESAGQSKIRISGKTLVMDGSTFKKIN